MADSVVPSIVVEVTTFSGTQYTEEWFFYKDGWQTADGFMDGICMESKDSMPIRDIGPVPLADIWTVLWEKQSTWIGPVGDMQGITKVQPCPF